ncbi:MAG: universal stress protein family [uncultured archaeon A07HR67]|jgi:Universal stress protein family.|nr:MAG: universal stress protein family [uncultured archaeon A07HR67]
MGVDIDLVLAPVDGSDESQTAIDGSDESQTAIDGSDESQTAIDGSDESQTAIDGSDESQTAIECAVALADRYGADLHVLHVLDDRVARELEAGDLSAASVADTTGRSTVECASVCPAAWACLPPRRRISPARLSQTLAALFWT